METLHRKAVGYWKKHTIHDGDIPFETAALSAGGTMQLFDAKKVGDVEWVICKPGETTPASFSYAAIVSIADPMETGNLVIDMEKRPDGLPATRVEKWASYKCSYTYVFDTSADQGLYTLQGVMDRYMESLPEFASEDQLPRRLWQSGNQVQARSQFWMRVPMFIRVREGERKQDPPDTVHDWVKIADSRSMWYRANPSPPQVHELVDGNLKPISECQPPKLMRGDAVAISFTLIYVVGRKDWYPVYFLTRLVRVAKGASVVRSTNRDDNERADGEVVPAPPPSQIRRDIGDATGLRPDASDGRRKRPRSEATPQQVQSGDDEDVVEWPASDDERHASKRRLANAIAGPSRTQLEDCSDDGGQAASQGAAGAAAAHADVSTDGSSDETSSSMSSVSTISTSSCEPVGLELGQVEVAAGEEQQDDPKGKRRADTATKRRTRGSR